MLRKLRHDYVINQVKRAKIPAFEKSDVIRMHYIFSGRVQKVGFRIEVAALAERLGLTGKIKNLPDGSVDLEIQGEKNKIDFLVKFMNSLIRIKITDTKAEEIDVIENETEFLSDKKD